MEIHSINKSDNFSIQQFTGLLDKNGKEIYEGDIVKLCGEAVISFGRRYHLVEFIRNGFAPDNICYPNEIEIVGNIFENKELLK